MRRVKALRVLKRQIRILKLTARPGFARVTLEASISTELITLKRILYEQVFGVHT
jgi:hypothetical protein